MNNYNLYGFFEIYIKKVNHTLLDIRNIQDNFANFGICARDGGSVFQTKTSL